MLLGFIGLGNIGTPMAQQIIRAGFSLTVHDVRETAAEPLLNMGASWADSPAELAEKCDIICTCLPGPHDTEQVVLGDNGLLKGFKSGSIYIDHTTNSPSTVQRLHSQLAESGIAMLDAPVSGGKEGAQTRDLTMLVGGDKPTFNKSLPVLQAMANTVMHVGDIGAGCICKIAHNSASFSIEMAMVECLTLGIKAGINPATLIEVFQKCALGRNFGIQVRLPSTLFNGDFAPRFSLDLARKDIGLATELAKTVEVPMSAINLCEREMSDAVARGWGRQDSSVFLTLQEERSGVKVRLSD